MSSRGKRRHRVAISRTPDLLGAFDRDGILTILTKDGECWRIFVKQHPQDDVAPFFIADLILATTGKKEILASGRWTEMMEIRDAVASSMLRQFSPCRSKFLKMRIALLGIIAFLAGLNIMLPYVDGRAPQTATMQPMGLPSGMPAMPKDIQTLPPGSLSRPAAPVSLDGAGAPSRQDVKVPAKHVQPEPSTSKPYALNVPPTISSPGLAEIAPFGPAASAPPDSLSPAVQATKLRTEATLDKERKEVKAMAAVAAALKNHGSVSQDDLSALPPDIAARVANDLNVPAPKIPLIAVNAAGHDKYGVPNIPSSLSWVGLEGPHVPPPGGGDVRTNDDMKQFGLAP